MNLSSPITPHASRLTATCYTASELAAARECTRQSMYARLQNVPTNSAKDFGGQKDVRAWPLAALPAALRRELEVIAARRNLTVEQLLTQPPRPWQPPKPFVQLSEPVQIAATNWRDSLALPSPGTVKFPRPNSKRWRAGNVGEFSGAGFPTLPGGNTLIWR